MVIIRKVPEKLSRQKSDNFFIILVSKKLKNKNKMWLDQ